jgi:hypothetical protein
VGKIPSSRVGETTKENNSKAGNKKQTMPLSLSKQPPVSNVSKEDQVSSYKGLKPEVKTTIDKIVY